MCIRVSVNGEHVDTVVSLMAEIGCGVGGIIGREGKPLERVDYDDCLCGVSIPATAYANNMTCSNSNLIGVDYELTNQA